MRCPFCAETIQDAAIVWRYCGATKHDGSWKPPAAASPVATKQTPAQGHVTLRTAGVLFILSAVFEIFSITAEVPLFGDLRGGVVAVGYHGLFVAVFSLMGIGLWRAIPADAGVAIEYKIPLTSKRIDFILTGLDEAGRDTAVVVELKQWTEARATDKDAVVETFVGGNVREVMHPSYQAWTYAALIRDFNEAAHDDRVCMRPCAYLHNLEDETPINSDFYREHTQKAPGHQVCTLMPNRTASMP